MKYFYSTAGMTDASIICFLPVFFESSNAHIFLSKNYVCTTFMKKRPTSITVMLLWIPQSNNMVFPRKFFSWQAGIFVEQLATSNQINLTSLIYLEQQYIMFQYFISNLLLFPADVKLLMLLNYWIYVIKYSVKHEFIGNGTRLNITSSSVFTKCMN